MELSHLHKLPFEQQSLHSGLAIASGAEPLPRLFSNPARNAAQQTVISAQLMQMYRSMFATSLPTGSCPEQCLSDLSVPGAPAVWDSSIVMAKFFERWPALVQGKRCLDLSAGCGLVGAGW